MIEDILSWEKTKEVREFRRLFLFSYKYHGEELLKIKIDLFYSCNYEDLIDLLEVEAPKEVFKYFKNNRVERINQRTGWNIGVSAESNVSFNRLWK